MSTVMVPNLATGERLKCSQCGMEIEIIEPCKCDETQPSFTCCGRPLMSAGRSFVAKTKDAFVDEVEQRMEEASDTVAWLREKAANAKDSAQTQASREAEAVLQQYDKLRESLGNIASASGDAWKDLALGFSDSWHRFKTAFDKAASRYR